jgi:hypothetical protein
MNSDQVILELASEVVDAFFLFKMRKKLVEHKEPRTASRDGTTYTGHIMQLPEGAGEGCFTTLVRSGYDNDAFFVFQEKSLQTTGDPSEISLLARARSKPS